jgi:hypothetical protein
MLFQKNIDLTHWLYAKIDYSNMSPVSINPVLFNSLGYVSDNYSAESDGYIMVCGGYESYFPATHVNPNWCDSFTEHYASITGTHHSKINVLNFSQPEGSMDYITRTLVSQSQSLHPNLVIISLCPFENTEYISSINNNKEQEFSLCFGDYFKNNLGNPHFRKSNPLKDHQIEHDQWDTIVDSACGYFEQFSKIQGLRDYLKHLQLLEYYLNQAGIPYLIWSTSESFEDQFSINEDFAPNCLPEKNIFESLPILFLGHSDSPASANRTASLLAGEFRYLVNLKQ